MIAPPDVVSTRTGVAFAVVDVVPTPAVMAREVDVFGVPSINRSDVVVVVFIAVALPTVTGAMETLVAVGLAVVTSVPPPAFVPVIALLFACVTGPTVLRIGVAAALLAAA
jgi:hypothetical protein